MKTLYRIFRFILVSAICILVVVPGLVFVALSVSPVQRGIADTCERELSKLLDCKVTVGDLGIIPFNRIVLRNVVVETAPGDTALTVRRLGAGIRLFSLVSGDPITVSYIDLTGMRISVYRDSANAPLNIQPIINALSTKESNKQPTAFDLKINTVMLRSSTISYDIMSKPVSGKFDPNHIKVSNLRADLRLPELKNNEYSISIKRMGFNERCGFSLANLTCDASVSDSLLAAHNFSLDFLSSSIRFNDFTLPLEGMKSIGKSLRNGNWQISVSSGSHVVPADLDIFLPEFHNLTERLTINELLIDGNLNDLAGNMEIEYAKGIECAIRGRLANLKSEKREIGISIFSAKAKAATIKTVTKNMPGLTPSLTATLNKLGNISISGEADLHGNSFSIGMTAKTDAGGLEMVSEGTFISPRQFSASVNAATGSFVDIASITGNREFGTIEGDVEAEIKRSGSNWSGSADLMLDRMVLKGCSYTDFKAHANLDNGMITASASIDNPNIALSITGGYSIDPEVRQFDLVGTLERVIPSELNLWNKFPGAEISGSVDIAAEGESLDHLTGSASLTDWGMRTPDGKSFDISHLLITSQADRITLRNDFIDGELTGTYNFKRLPEVAKAITNASFPALTTGNMLPDSTTTNNFHFELRLKETERLAEFFKLPLSIVYPAQINGAVNEPDGDIALNFSAPFIRSGNKLIEDTRLTAFANSHDGIMSLDMGTITPTQHGPLKLLFQASGQNNTLDTEISWMIDREREYNGDISASTHFSRNNENTLQTDIELHPGALTFNDSTWIVNPATVNMTGTKKITINGINVHRNNQFVKIAGTASDSPLAMLTVDLRNFNLDYLFESLGIDKVMLGGDATGTFYASQLLSKEPMLETPGLAVKGISYNKVVLGNALVRSRWDAIGKAISLNATIDQPDNRRSFIDGAIFPMNDSLDITFTVDHANVGFMKPYMEAFASDITGQASGRARLWGNFKYIDLEGDVFAHDLKLKVNFTNTYYSATDSVHFRPGFIDLNGISIRDSEGHTANLNGWVRHKFFKEPTFGFSVTGARNFLAYNETANDNETWYGQIYGNGSAFVNGVPGRVDINVDMATAAKSSFTFVLSDREVADEFSFLTFRDKNSLSKGYADTLTMQRDTSMDIVNRLRAGTHSAGNEEASDYNISLQMRVTPEAQINLIMDPVGGDHIRAYGSGHLRMDYGSANNDLKIYGTYTLDRGDYNFTLQDIIIKEFNIRSGSSISFQGDPYAALLNIQAIYALNANLSDLDESFLQDKDLNRTNVPVHAVMLVSGDMRQPEIDFDLEFPTLTTDIYRKVRSIISTDDMMNRQIIYLLALNRFYTPEYMASTTKGNELVSVASSTISSQLSNMLGQISENWNIAPTFRSDRGDFSDVEFDVALSSRLLNNRLLFNGNFGYRDNAMNTSQFVGDFDLEYLLDRMGMWRLKAYNRYNDQNYYLRTAPTTQGVGVVLKRDFNSFFSFLRAFRKKEESTPAADNEPANAK